VRRVGVHIYWAADDVEGRARLAAFTQALQQLGWSEGRHLRIDTRATANADELRRHAAELVALAPDVLVAAFGTASVAALLQATRSVPIVFVTVIDPVGAGFVAQPGAAGRQRDRGWRCFGDPTVASGIGQFGAIQIVAPSLGVQLSPVDKGCPRCPRCPTPRDKGDGTPRLEAKPAKAIEIKGVFRSPHKGCPRCPRCPTPRDRQTGHLVLRRSRTRYASARPILESWSFVRTMGFATSQRMVCRPPMLS